MTNALGELFGDIASAIREKTGDAEKMKPAKFPEKISEIETGADVSGVTATAEDVLNGKKFVDAGGNVIDGTMPNLGSKIIWWRNRPIRNPEAINQGGIAILEIEEGYHDGTSGIQLTFEYPKRYTPTKERKRFSSSYSTGMFLGDIDIDPIPDQYQDVTPVTATAEDVRAGKVFVDAEGNAVEGALSGTIADVSGVTATAADVRQGKVIVDAQGNEVVGTLVVEQKAPDVVWVGKDSVANALVGTGVIRYVTFCNHDGTETYGQKSVIAGENCVDPVTAGHMETPTRESTAEHTFTFSGGWATEPNGGKDSNALKNVTEDRTVYANFIAAVRYYTVTYYDSDGVTVLKTESLAYGATPSYVPTSADYTFDGWVPATAAVTGDASYTAKWKAKPAFATSSWAEIKAIADAGLVKESFNLGDTRTDTLTFADGTTEEITWVLVDATGVYEYTPFMSSKKVVEAGMILMAAHGIKKAGNMKMSNTMATSYRNSFVHAYLRDELPNFFSAELREVIVKDTAMTYSLAWAAFPKELGLSTSTGETWNTFEYFADGNAEKLIRKMGADGEATPYWTRSHYGINGSTNGHYYVTTEGKLAHNSASNDGAYAIVPCIFI